jgi:hypothetical protein
VKATTRHTLITCLALSALAGCATQQRMTLDQFAQKSAPVEEARIDNTDRIACAGGVVTSEQDATHFAACEVIDGDLAIQNTSFSNLGAFVNLREVRGMLRITDNPELESVDGLSNLESAKSLVISNTPRLESLTGFEGLSELHGLVLHRTGSYTVEGLNNLTRVGTLVVTDNPKLISLSALNGITHATRVRIEANPRLAGQLGLLPSLETVERPVVLKSNRGLSSREISTLETRGETLVAEVAETSEKH